MNAKNSRTVLALAAVLITGIGNRTATAGVVDFDDLPLAPNTFFNGPIPNGQLVPGQFEDVIRGTFASRGVRFVNEYAPGSRTWGGFAYSNTTDTTSPQLSNQFSAITGTGHGPGADNYGVATGYIDVVPTLFDPVPFDPTDPAELMALPTFILSPGSSIAGMYVTNTTYTVQTLLNGNGFAKKFGGAAGNDPDFLKLTAYGTDASGRPLANSVDFYLADYRSPNNTLDFIVTDWRFLDLSSLSGARELHFNISSSDFGSFGLNSPAYFAVDDIQTIEVQAVPEPTSLALLLAGTGFLAALSPSRKSSTD